jgi:hypothetical protein
VLWAGAQTGLRIAPDDKIQAHHQYRVFNAPRTYGVPLTKHLESVDRRCDHRCRSSDLHPVAAFPDKTRMGRAWVSR